MTIATPKPTRQSRKPFKLAAARRPRPTPSAATIPQKGVVGGVPHAEKTTGTPGAAHLGSDVH